MTFCENKHHYSWRIDKEANFLCLCSLFTLPDCKDFGEYIYTKQIILIKLSSVPWEKLQYKLFSNAVKHFHKVVLYA